MRGKRIIVTGGTYGIGASIVKALVEAGAGVAFMGRSVEIGNRICRELGAGAAVKPYYHRCDVSDRGEVKAAFATVTALLGGLDGLVHVAGVEAECAPESETDEQWLRTMAINATGTFIANQEAFPYLKDSGGSIVNFGSGAGSVGMADAGAYAASKGAVLGWSRSIAAAWGRHGIRVNIVCPAVVSPMYLQFRARASPEVLAEHDAQIARTIHIGGKLGEAATDIVPLVLFLLGDGAGFVTGQTLNADGGMIMSR